jgi:hypothetical protein
MGRIDRILSRKIFNDLDVTNISEYQRNQINKILSVYDDKEIKNRLKNIHGFIKYNVDGDWLDRINIIRTKLKTVANTDYSLEVRYGLENVEAIKAELLPKYAHTKSRYVEKYGDISGETMYQEYLIKSSNPWGLDSCIQRYGDIEGPIKWTERLNKKIETQKKRKLIKPYRNGRTLIEYQNRYGIEDGYNRWLKRNLKQSYRFSEMYYIDTYGETEGKVKWGQYCSDMSKTSLNSFIKKYGEVLGRNRYNDHIEHLKYVSSLKYYLDRYGDVKGLEYYKDIIAKKNVSLRTVRYSNISQDLFWSLYESMTDKNSIYFGELNQEYVFYVWEDWANIIEVDFKFGDKIIEFDGDYWHSSEAQQTKDKLRDAYLVSKGYSVMRIKESDYKVNKIEVINKCLTFLNCTKK